MFVIQTLFAMLRAKGVYPLSSLRAYPYGVSECVCVCVCVCVCASGEDAIHETYKLLISLKVVATTVTRKSLDIKMYGSFLVCKIQFCTLNCV